jgi:hypothetical protein
MDARKDVPLESGHRKPAPGTTNALERWKACGEDHGEWRDGGSRPVCDLGFADALALRGATHYLPALQFPQWGHPRTTLQELASSKAALAKISFWTSLVPS